MSTVEELLERYRERVQMPWDPALSGSQRVWFVVYDPVQERRLRLRLPDFQTATEGSGHAWCHIDLTDAFANWLGSHRRRDAYFKDPDKATFAMDAFAQHLAENLSASLTDPEVTANTVVAVTGVASLFGLVRVSPLIEAVKGVIPGRLAVFFPGQYDEQSYFRLLDARDGWDYLAVPITASRS
jgi:hypothetical protein